MQQPSSNRKLTRRYFLSRTAATGLALGAAVSAVAKESTTNSEPKLEKTVQAGEMSCGTLGRLKISRLISGGNLISGWCHQRDLLFVRQLAEAYLTEKKQFDTLQMLEEAGVNAIMIDMEQVPIVKRYKLQRGGKIQMIVSVRQGWGQWGEPHISGLKTEISRAIDQGSDTVFLHGGYCDHLVKADEPAQIDLLGQALAFIREQKLSAGLGSHALEVPMECDKRGVEPDYYVKTFHHDRYWSATPKDRRKRFCVDGPVSLDHNEFHDNIFCIDPVETAEYMRDKKQPWIAFKVLAAGAISPQSGFEYAFENGADFLAVGMFDFNVAEDVAVARQVIADVKRDRPWRA